MSCIVLLMFSSLSPCLNCGDLGIGEMIVYGDRLGTLQVATSRLRVTLLDVEDQGAEGNIAGCSGSWL